MENNQELSKDSERRKLQEDIERLRDVIGDDDFNSDDEADENVLQIDFNSTVPTEGDEEFRQTPGAISSCAGSVIPEASADDEDDRDEIVINLNENVPIDPDTCLALNKAYQEVLLDTLRSIEMALIENRDKQNRIHDNLVENPKKLKASADCKRSVTSYQRPFFMDKNGNVPPPNTDVVIKKSTDEQRQDIKPSFPWRKKMKEELKQAVYLNALDQQTRPLLNRKEIYYEKLNLMSKEANGEQYDKMSEKIDELDTEIHRLSMLEKNEILNMSDTKRIDWMKISNTTMNNVRDPGECELYWNNELKPSINKQVWTTSEKQKLKELAEKYDHRNWPTIAKELGTNRTPFQCLQYYQQNLNEVFNKRPWTELEDQMLIEVVDNCRVGTTISWTQVSYFMEGRSSMQCSQRWVQINPEIKRGKWSEEEDMKLLSAVYLYGEKDWEKIAEFVPQRSVAQCRERYKSSLNPKLRPPHEWTYEEDRRMLMITEQLKKEDGKIPWAQAAEMMEGRSDNMILCRHRKLMEWKEKCEWLEKQDTKVRTELGYIDLEGLASGDSKSKNNHSLRKSKDPEIREKQSADDYKRLLYQLSKLPVNEYKLDYITQLKDKREGNFVVPRPPLMYRYTRRNTTNIWARKRHMKTLLENHLAKLQIIKPEDRVMIPEKTAEEFKPFSTLNEKQMDRIQKVLQKKNPCEISVRELIEMTNDKQAKCAEVCAHKRARKSRIEIEIEKRICDILQYKHCYITKWRRPSGRPRKFYIFYPGGRKPNYFEHENTVQLSTVTSTLLLNALEIDGKKAMAVYKTLSPKIKKALKQYFELLCKCFPQTPPKVTRATPGQSRSTVTSAAGTASTSTSSGSTVTKTTQSSKLSSKGTTNKRKGSLDSDEPKTKMGCPQIRLISSDTEDENLQKKSDESMSKIIDSIVESARLETCGHEEEKVDKPIHQTRSKGKSPKNTSKILKTVNKEKTSPGRKRTSTDNQKEEPSAKVVKSSNVVPVTMTTTVSSPGSIVMPKIITLNKSSSAGGPVPTALIMNTSINKPDDRSMVAPMMIGANTLKRGQQLPTSNPRVIVLRQPSVSPCAKKFPILPPCVTTMRGYEEFLIQSNLLKSRAGNMYNPYFYNERAGVLKSRLKAVKKEDVVSKLDFNDKIDRALEHSAKKVNAVLGGRSAKLEKASFMIHPKKDLLKNVRHTPEYIKLKKRFDALFLWPAFLSLLKPEKENVFDTVDKDANLVTYDEWVEIDAKEDRKPEVKTEEKETEEKPKSAYTEARVKLFQKHKQQHRDKKLQIRMKRRMAKLLQMKSIAEKGREKIRQERKAKEEENFKKKINRFKHLGKRKSKRLLIKQEKITADDTPDSQSTKPKLRSLKSLTREMQKRKKRKVIDTSESKKSVNDNKVSMTTADATNSNEPIIPNVAQASGEVIPPGFIMIPSPGQMLNMSGMVGGIMPQLSGMFGGMVPFMLPQQSSSLTQTTQTIGTLPQGMVPVMLPQSSALTQTTQTIGTLPQGMMQPMLLMPSATTGASTSTMTPFPFLLMPGIEGNNALSSVTIAQNATAQTNSGSSPMVGQYQGLQSPQIQSTVTSPEMCTDSIMPMIETSSPTVPTIIVSPEKTSVKSPETPSSSENLSHVFLGTAGKGGNPMLISVPKDSNMTVKELIRMMGNRGKNSELDTEGDNPIVNLMGDNSTNNAMGDNSTENSVEDNSM